MLRTTALVLLLTAGCGGEEVPVPVELNPPTIPQQTLEPLDAPEVLSYEQPTPGVQQLPQLKTACYPDLDGDRYGDVGAKPLEATVCPAGYVTNNKDCADGEIRAYPGQHQYFSTPVKGKPTVGVAAWDFDCDGKISLVHAGPAIDCEAQQTEADCYQFGDLGDRHWIDVVPACGASGQIVRGFGCSWNGKACAFLVPAKRYQRCR